VTLMVAYGKLAAWYDRLMAGVPYDRWLRFAEAYWEKRGLRPRVVADVGCGTGNTAIAFAASGMRVYGIDLSEDMLAVAAAKEARVREEGRSCAPVVWLRQDMRELELPEPVDAAVSFCDCLNYLLEEDDLSQAFAAVYRALKPGGTFLFDMHAPETLRRYAHDQPFVLTEPDVCYIWTCRFDDRRCEIEHDLTVFVRSGRSDCYERFGEVHIQRAYSWKRVAEKLRAVGFVDVDVFSDFTWKKPGRTSLRLFFGAVRP